MILKLKRTPGIYLVGFMGSGKSTVGEQLADQLGWQFADLDADIVRQQGTAISDIFDAQGESAFRAIENEALRKRVRAVQTGRPTVLALGGGAYVDERNQHLLTENGISVWLDCPLERIIARLGSAVASRPLARDPEKFAELYHVRRGIYARCDYRVAVDTDDAAAVTASILALPLFGQTSAQRVDDI